jgi:ABC-2 type transport system permease protein
MDPAAARSGVDLANLDADPVVLPPAMLLWVTFHDRNDSFVLLIPVVVMAAGQLAGGLAWLSISGEDAPDLVARADRLPSHPLGQDRSGDRHDHVCVCADRGGADARFSVCRCCLRARNSLRSRGGDRDPALFPRAGAPQAVSPQADVVPSRYVCRGVFLAATTAIAASASWAALGTAVVAFGVLAAVWLISPSRA